MNNLELQDKLRIDIERQEIYFQYWLSKILLWGLILLPLTPAGLTCVGIATHYPKLLGLPVWACWIIGLLAASGIEFLGLGSVKLMLGIRKYNQAAQEMGLDAAPIWQSVAVVLFYLGIVLSLTVMLKIWPGLAIWSLIPLGIMGFVADWYYGLKQDHDEREMALEQQQTNEKEDSEKEAEIERLKSELEIAKDEAENLRHNADAILSEVGQKIADLSEVATHLHTKILPEFRTEILAEIAQKFPTDSHGNSERILTEILSEFLTEIEQKIQDASARNQPEIQTDSKPKPSQKSDRNSQLDSDARRRKILECYRDGITKPADMLDLVPELNGNAKTVSADKKWLIAKKYLTTKLNVTKLGQEWIDVATPQPEADSILAEAAALLPAVAEPHANGTA